MRNRKKGIYMINELVREVEYCLDHGCYMAALATALILPDICGKAKYPKMEKHTKQRYIKWFDEYIGEYEKDPEDTTGMPYLSGELVYSLRCSILHQGNPNIEGKKQDIEYFELLYRKEEGASVRVNCSEARIVEANGKEIAVNKKYCVNVRMLCFKLCCVAMYFYKQHKELFNFFNYKIVDCDFQTRRAFGIKD